MKWEPNQEEFSRKRTDLVRATVRLINYLQLAGLGDLNASVIEPTMGLIEIASLQTLTGDEREAAPWLAMLADWHGFVLSGILCCSQESLMATWCDPLPQKKNNNGEYITTRSIPKITARVNKFLQVQVSDCNSALQSAERMGTEIPTGALDSWAYSVCRTNLENQNIILDPSEFESKGLPEGLTGYVIQNLAMQRFSIGWDELDSYTYQLQMLHAYTLRWRDDAVSTPWTGTAADIVGYTNSDMAKLWLLSLALILKKCSNHCVLNVNEPLLTKVPSITMLCTMPLWIIRDSVMEILANTGIVEDATDSNIIGLWDICLNNTTMHFQDLRKIGMRFRGSVESRIGFPQRDVMSTEESLISRKCLTRSLWCMLSESIANVSKCRLEKYVMVAELPTDELSQNGAEFLVGNFARVLPITGTVENLSGSLIAGVSDADLICRVGYLSRETIENLKVFKWKAYSVWLALQFAMKVFYSQRGAQTGVGRFELPEPTTTEFEGNKDGLYLVASPSMMAVVPGAHVKDSVSKVLGASFGGKLYDEIMRQIGCAGESGDSDVDTNGNITSDSSDEGIGYDQRLSALAMLADYMERDFDVQRVLEKPSDGDTDLVVEQDLVSQGPEGDAAVDDGWNPSQEDNDWVMKYYTNSQADKNSPGSDFSHKRDCIKVSCANSGVFSNDEIENVVAAFENLEFGKDSDAVVNYKNCDTPEDDEEESADDDRFLSDAEIMEFVTDSASVINQFEFGVSPLPDMGQSQVEKVRLLNRLGEESYTHTADTLGDNRILFMTNQFCKKHVTPEVAYSNAKDYACNLNSKSRAVPGCYMHAFTNAEYEHNKTVLWSPMLIMKSDMERQFKPEVVSQMDYWVTSKMSGVLAITGAPGSGKSAALKELGIRAIKNWGIGSIYVLSSGIFGGGKMPFQSNSELPQKLRQIVTSITKRAQGNVLLVMDDMHKVPSNGRDDPLLQFVDTAYPITQAFPKVKFAFTCSASDFQKCASDIECAGLRHIQLGKFDVENAAILKSIDQVVGNTLELERDPAKIQQMFSKCEKLVEKYIDSKKTPLTMLQTAEAAAIGYKRSLEDIGGLEGSWEGLMQFMDCNSTGLVTTLTGKKYDSIKLDRSVSLLNIEKELKKSIRGQDDAISVIARSLRRASFVVNDPNRPISSMLFVGPTGVGKTGLAKALAKYQFGSEKSMIRVDMSEYSERFNISKFIGSPPGYVGYKAGSAVTDLILKDPQSILLLDEIEKASPQVLTLLLQILDEGHITDATGVDVDCTNLIVIMTSNIGSRELFEKKGRLGFGTADESEFNTNTEIVMSEVKKAIAPELFNRIDATIVFNALSQDIVEEIFDVMMSEISSRLAVKGIVLHVTPDTKARLCEIGFDKKFGARPLRRTIESKIVDGVIVAVLEKGCSGDCVVRCEYDREEDKFKFTVVPY